MKQERRHGMRRRQRHFPLALGLIASALLHLLLVLLNPRMVAPSYGRAGETTVAPGSQLTVLSLSLRDEDRLIQLDATRATATLRSPPFVAPRSGSGEAGGPGRDARSESRDATVAERLRYNGHPFPARAARVRESASQRALRETRERVLRAGAELGPLPPSGVAGSRGGGGGGIRIPFGFKPPPPAQTVPAPPLPDSILRRDSMRAAARAAARRDSLRAARDTTRLRNVAPRRPVVVPRVVPDTTASER